MLTTYVLIIPNGIFFSWTTTKHSFSGCFSSQTNI